jgi:hypothetical protein
VHSPRAANAADDLRLAENSLEKRLAARRFCMQAALVELAEMLCSTAQ